MDCDGLILEGIFPHASSRCKRSSMIDADHLPISYVSDSFQNGRDFHDIILLVSSEALVEQWPVAVKV